MMVMFPNFLNIALFEMLTFVIPARGRKRPYDLWYDLWQISFLYLNLMEILVFPYSNR